MANISTSHHDRLNNLTLWLGMFIGYIYSYLVLCLKELEHRKLGRKVLLWKYDLGKSLSKQMWWNMADNKKLLTTYLKRWKMHVIWSKSFLCPWTKKMIPLIMNGILEMSWFVHLCLQNKRMVPLNRSATVNHDHL